MNCELYFDWAATTPPDRDILENALEISQKNWGNPSSLYTHGKKAREILEDARSRAATALGCKREQIFFTSGGTESDHIPMLSILNRPYNKGQESRGTVLISAVEHPAVREMGTSLKNCGYRIKTIPSDVRGIITADAVMNVLTDDTVLVCVMAVNNETGAVQPIYEIADALSAQAKATGKRRARLHVDCVQAIGKIPFDLTHTGIDSAAISAHKICGPRGIGALYLADGGRGFEAFTKGGGQEHGLRSGTENIFGAVALSLCLERYAIRVPVPDTSASRTVASAAPLSRVSSTAPRATSGAVVPTLDVLPPFECYEQQKNYTARFIKQLLEIRGCSIVPDLRTSSSASPCDESNMCADRAALYSPWIVQAAFKNIPGQVLVRALDSDGFAISTGSACSSSKQSRPVLEAMHVPSAVRENAVRFSFGTHTTENAMNALLAELRKVAEKFR